MERSAVFWPTRPKIGRTMTSAAKAIRCAIYTRVSTEAGLDQEFNSLDAQYDAAFAYIRSQAHAHWTLVRTRYDNGGFSGGSTDRPALQRLLADVKAHKINVVVVYKVDRLTRSLADFAKLVELFDAHGISFVSVTQQFNTTTSMGRLTLNVLLSFAQFEREVTAERIRDKKQSRRFASSCHLMQSLLGQFGLHRLKELTLQERRLRARADLVLKSSGARHCSGRLLVAARGWTLSAWARRSRTSPNSTGAAFVTSI
jgi:DNA invertase Pin-like site-specific DNA recombinase